MRCPVLLVALTLTSVLPDIALHAQTDTAGGLRLAPGDRVRVEVAGDSTLSGDFDVDAAGMVLVPLVGLVPVAGRPFEDVASLVIAGFDAELVGVPVRVLPLLRIPVLGEVYNPGLFWVDRTMTLSEVLAVAGGLTESARVDKVRVQRMGEELVLSADDREPLVLVPRDRIFVGRRGFFSENGPFLIGATASVLAALVTSLILR